MRIPWSVLNCAKRTFGFQIKVVTIKGLLLFIKRREYVSSMLNLFALPQIKYPNASILSEHAVGLDGEVRLRHARIVSRRGKC